MRRFPFELDPAEWGRYPTPVLCRLCGMSADRALVPPSAREGEAASRPPLGDAQPHRRRRGKVDRDAYTAG